MEASQVYDGLWANGKKHGFGMHVWPDGREYEVTAVDIFFCFSPAFL